MAGYQYNIIIKERGFTPAPVGMKIPIWADGKNNPDCIGSKFWTEFWEEQLYYCIHGYNTGGLFIPPKYYDYLNFSYIDGVGGHGKIVPYFTDAHYELFNEEYEIRNDSTCAGLVCAKTRRFGWSFFSAQLMKHGFKFTPNYRAAVTSGLTVWTDGLRGKLYRNYNECPDELMINHITRNDKMLAIGYEEQTEQGFQKRESAAISFVTMEDNATKLEGEYFNDVFLEEVGEFLLAERAMTSITPALKDGEDFKGKFWVGGTGSEMNRAGKVFANIWHNAESLHLKRLFVPGRRFYAPFVRRAEGKVVTPYLDAQYPDLSPEQLLGCEDIKAAQESLDNELLLLSKHPDKKKLIQHKQNYPNEIEDVFISSGSNKFNAESLYQQGYNIDTLTEPKWQEWVLEFKKDDEGNLLMPLQVEIRLPMDFDKDWERVKIYKHPELGYTNLDFGGADCYNEDKTDTTTSLGAVAVVRQNDKGGGIPTEEPGKIPICIYYGRPPRKEKHWEITLKISIYYNLIKNMMISAESDACIAYFKDMGCKKYLSVRPKTFDSADGKQMHEFGMKMTSYSKPRMLSLMQSWVEDNVQWCWFKEIIYDLVAYDDTNIGNDWDLADALGLCLSRIADNKQAIRNVNDSEEDVFRMRHWKATSSGAIIDGDNDEDEIKKLFKEDKVW